MSDFFWEVWEICLCDNVPGAALKAPHGWHEKKYVVQWGQLIAKKKKVFKVFNWLNEKLKLITKG